LDGIGDFATDPQEQGEKEKWNDLETATVRPRVIARPLPSLLLVKDEAMLFEVSVEKVSLIVSGLNHVRR